LPDKSIGTYSYVTRDGFIDCEWTQTIRTLASQSLYNLRGGGVYIGLWRGTLDANDNSTTNTSRPQGAFTQHAVNFPPCDTPLSHVLVKAHAWLMIIAWVGLSTISTIIARYCRKALRTYTNQGSTGHKLWFYIHLGLNLSLIICQLLGITLIMIHANGWSGNHAHAICGIIVFTGSMLQAFAGILRPTSQSSARPLFNTFHSTLGWGLQILAFTTLFLTKPGYEIYDQVAFEGVLIAVVSTWAFVHILMMWSTRAADGFIREESNTCANCYQYNPHGVCRCSPQGGCLPSWGLSGDSRMIRYALRRFILGLYVLATGAFVVALMVISGRSAV